MTEAQLCELYIMLKLDRSENKAQAKKNLVSSVFPVYATKYLWSLHSQQVIFGVQGTSLFINNDAGQRKSTKKCNNADSKGKQGPSLV